MEYPVDQDLSDKLGQKASKAHQVLLVGDSQVCSVFEHKSCLNSCWQEIQKG